MSQTLKQPRSQAGTAHELPQDKTTFAPNVDIWEDDHEIVLFSDIPGVEENSLDIHFENRQLTIHGKVTPRNEDANFLGGEYGIGDFYRSFTIGDAIDSSKISAELKNGVLTLHLPKMEAVKPRKIPVRAH